MLYNLKISFLLRSITFSPSFYLPEEKKSVALIQMITSQDAVLPTECSGDGVIRYTPTFIFFEVNFDLEF